jgi:hypothetical protein
MGLKSCVLLSYSPDSLRLIRCHFKSAQFSLQSSRGRRANFFKKSAKKPANPQFLGSSRYRKSTKRHICGRFANLTNYSSPHFSICGTYLRTANLCTVVNYLSNIKDKSSCSFGLGGGGVGGGSCLFHSLSL